MRYNIINKFVPPIFELEWIIFDSNKKKSIELN